ncbi:MAG TPA: hypothetical protein PKD78_10840, partial [Saprospiraceae bacterium]|nr:hypothetical protein [Saprospiraceae bacterium]
PLWAKRINRGSQTWLPDWPAQAQMLVRNEAVYLSCNAVISGSFGPEVSLIVKLQPDGTLANCSAVEPTPVAEIPFGMFAAVEMPLSASPSPLQAKAISAPVQGDGLSLTSANICQQTGYLCNDRPDLRAQVDSISCSATGGPVAHMRLCNLGKVKPSSGVHVTFYSHNPLAAAATPLQLAFLEEKPDSGQCLQVLVPLLPALLQQAKIYLLVGVKDDVPTPISLGGFPYPEGFAECEYANNLDSFEVKLPSGKVLDLGPDRSICSGDALTLEAPEGFAQYTWQDGSTGRQLVVTEPGVYRVTVADGCGTAQRDSLSVVWAPRPVRQELVLLLPGESIVIAGNTYSSAANFEVVAPSGTGVCDTLVQYKIVVSEDGCKAPKSFLKTFTGSVGKVIVAAKDGYVYILGEEFGGNSLAKFDSAGVLVWARQIIRDLIEPGGFVYPTSMIEDSDGMLTVCGDHSSTSQPIVFRYNPATDHMMWVRRVQSDSGTSFGLAQDILEDGAGGDFLLVIEVDDVLDLFAKGEVFRLSRSTGNLWGTATRYRAAQFRKASVQGQALYVTGSFQDNLDHNNKSGGVVKIDLLSKAPLWAKRMSVLLPNGYEGRDLILDQEGNLISLFSKTNEFILQKSSPDGTLIWQRKYGHVGQANSLANNIRLLDNGDYVLAVAGNYTSHSSIIITRISKDGPVQ